ncbi:helix-turn-helix domain-containing protein [Hazenella coriacea]|uniref:Tetratricopeptide repeat protein n=1 Tax=Hazenella coriacea TaxID=1179467 RepID=A0A4R3L8S3_9BACL|nr:helix-turn-helix domain-containing protein [Hazenella coriacea]TCS95460.1 tetratricopeptide repeat protein [Hazenella coriacea]
MDFIKLGQFIRKIRKERGMTLDDLCDDYIPRSTLSSIERGQTQNSTKVRYILKKLDIQISDLTEREKKEAEDRQLELMIIENQINSDPKKALKRLSELPTEYEGPLLDFLKGMCYYRSKQIDKSVKLFSKSLEKLEKSIDPDQANLKSSCLNYLSIVEFQYYNNKEKALRYIDDALNHFELNNKRRYLHTNLLINKAIYLRSLGRAEEALKALDEIEFQSFDINIETVISLYDLRAKLKWKIQLYDEAASYAKQGLEIARINYNYERQVELYNTLSDIYTEKGSLDHAKKCLLAAIDLKDKISRRHWLLLNSYLKLGIVFFNQKKYDLSITILEKAKEIADNSNDMVKYTQILLYIGKNFLSQSKKKKL